MRNVSTLECDEYSIFKYIGIIFDVNIHICIIFLYEYFQIFVHIVFLMQIYSDNHLYQDNILADVANI